MENTRRKLRNNNNCPDLSNIFNPDINDSALQEILPPDIFDKISTTQKITCNNVLLMPELKPPQNARTALEMCIRAEEYQKTWQTEDEAGCMQVEKVAGSSTQVKHEPEYLDYFEVVANRGDLKEKKHIQAGEESLLEKKDIWADTQFMENLNSFLIMQPNRGSFWSEDYFMK